MRKIYFGISLICSLMAFQLSHAGIYWLPDYLKDNIDTNHRTETDKGGGDLPLDCANYSPSCTSPQILGGKKVRIGNIFCSSECVCPSSYQYTSENCTGEYMLGTATCDGKANSCSPRPCSDGGYYDNANQTGMTCTTVTYGGRTCYQCVDSCSGLTDHKEDKDCKAFGCSEEYGNGCSYCKNCHTDNCRNRDDNETKYGCDKYWDDCASKCETGTTCSATDCSEYTLSNKPANAEYASCTPGCGNSTTTYKLVSCNTGYTDDENGSCRAKTCKEIDPNTKTCGTTCIPTSACCDNDDCATGQTCQNGSCTQLCTAPEAAQGWGTSSTCQDLYLPDVYLARQSQTDKCGQSYYRCCKMPYGCSFDFTSSGSSGAQCNYGYYVTYVNPEETGLSFVPEKISNLPNPSVTITPQAFTGTGEGSCHASNSDFIEESFADCGITYSRRCLDLSVYRGWSEMTDYWPSTGDSCSDGYSYGEFIVQEDGCERFYSCCNKKDCREYDAEFMELYNTFVKTYVNKCPSSYVRKKCESDERKLIDLAQRLEENCYMSGIDYHNMMMEYDISNSYVCYFYQCMT